jgi:hypothetical protein
MKRNPKKVTDSMALTGCYNVVIGLILLKHEPHRFHIVTSEAPDLRR